MFGCAIPTDGWACSPWIRCVCSMITPISCTASSRGKKKKKRRRGIGLPLPLSSPCTSPGIRELCFRTPHLNVPKRFIAGSDEWTQAGSSHEGNESHTCIIDNALIVYQTRLQHQIGKGQRTAKKNRLSPVRGAFISEGHTRHFRSKSEIVGGRGPNRAF